MTEDTKAPGGRVPRVGDIVWYYVHTGVAGTEPIPRAAMITEVHEPDNRASSVALTVFTPDRAPAAGGYHAVQFSPKPIDGCWGWRPESG